ncbi:MAG: TonB-dependent receptor [Marinilabiliales bacterium]|nr:TonB-dependent receptor [Marinilabiliales bacterium]
MAVRVRLPAEPGPGRGPEPVLLAEPRQPGGLQHPRRAGPGLSQDLLRRPVAGLFGLLPSDRGRAFRPGRDRLRRPGRRRRRQHGGRFPGPVQERQLRHRPEPGDLRHGRPLSPEGPALRHPRAALHVLQGPPGPSGIIELIPELRLSGWAPSLKVTYLDGRSNTFYVSLARALRMPTAPEHYWHYDADDAGVDTSGLPFTNEDGLMVQAGAKVGLAAATSLEISPYYYSVRDYIQFDLINFVSYNIEDARIYGVEAELVQRFGRRWSAFVNYSLTGSRTNGDTFLPLFVDPQDADFNEVPGIPAHRANFGVRYRLPRNASLGLFAQAVSSQQVIYNNNTLYNTAMRVRTQPGYVRVDFEFRYPLRSFLEMNAFVRNLFDEVYQERYPDSPVAGRTIGLSFKSRF